MEERDNMKNDKKSFDDFYEDSANFEKNNSHKKDSDFNFNNFKDFENKKLDLYSQQKNLIKKLSSNHKIILTRNLFLKTLAIVYLAALASVFVQIQGLWGDEGLLPAKTFKEKLLKSHKNLDLTTFPSISVFYSKYIHELLLKSESYLFTILSTLDSITNLNLFTSTKFHLSQFAKFSAMENSMHFFCLIGVFISLSITLNFKLFYNCFGFIALFLIYLNHLLLGQVFMSFQWDIYILEVGFLAIFIAPSSYNNIAYISAAEELAFNFLKLLNFKFMYSSGVVKITANCPTWLSFTALHHHFQSQPLPNILAYYAHFLDDWIKKVLVAGTFIVELYIPFLLCLPSFLRRFQIFAGILVFFFEMGIILTGNYNFFNFLTLVVNLSAFDDDFLRTIFSNKFWSFFELDPINNIVKNEEENTKNDDEEIPLDEKLITIINNLKNSSNNEEDIQNFNNYIKDPNNRRLLNKILENNQSKKFNNNEKLVNKSSIIYELVIFSCLTVSLILISFTYIYPYQELVDGSLKLSKKDLDNIFDKSSIEIYFICIFIWFFMRYFYAGITLEANTLKNKLNNNLFSKIDKFQSNYEKNKSESKITKLYKMFSFIEFIFNTFKFFCYLLFFVLFYVHWYSVFSRSLSIRSNLTNAEKNTFSIKNKIIESYLNSETLANDLFERFHVTSGYGLFRVMTGVGGRPELEIFYTDKSYPPSKEEEWKIVNFKYKPQEHKNQLLLNIPHQPRIDWQIWFSALRPNINSEGWLVSMLGKIMEKNPVILDLLGYKVLEKNRFYKISMFEKLYEYIFNLEKPVLNDTPSLIKINQYKYYFNPQFEHFNSEKISVKNKIWVKKHLGEYLQPVNTSSLKEFFISSGLPPIDPHKKVSFNPFQFIPILDIIFFALFWKFYLLLFRKNLDKSD